MVAVSLKKKKEIKKKSLGCTIKKKKSHKRKNIESNCPSYSKDDLIQIAIKNGYSASESINASKSKLCSILNPSSISLENEIMPKVCGPSKSIKFPNVYSRDELIHSLIDKGYLPEIVSRMSTKHLCNELGLEGKHINENKEKNIISMTKRTCSPKKYGGYSKEELVQIAINSGYRKSDATKASVKDLCKLFKIPYQYNKSPSKIKTQASIRPDEKPIFFKDEKVNYYIDDPNSCSLYSREGETFCNSIIDKKSGQEVCKFDTYNNKCGVKLRIQSESVIDEKKLSQLEELINESYTTFDIKLRQLLEQKYFNFEPHQISKAVEEIKNQNVASFNNKFVEFIKNIINKTPVLSLSDKNNIDNWILQYVSNLVNKYEIKLSRDMLETEKKNSLEEIISKQKEEIEHKIEHIEELKNIEKKSNDENKQEEIDHIIKEEEKEIKDMIDDIENKEQKKDEIISKIEQIKNYYKEKGQTIDIDESSINSDKENKIKLEATIYDPIETMYKNYIDNSSYLKNMEAKHAILEKNLKLAYRLVDRLRSEISSNNNKNPLLDNTIEEKIKLESEITSLNKRMLLLQDEMKTQLLKINKYEQYNPKHTNNKLSEIISNNNIIKGKKINTTLDNLYNSISN